MPAKGVQSMCIRSRDHGFVKPSCDSLCLAIRIERANVKMTELNRVETIDLCKKTRSDRAAENIERVRRYGENGISPARPELFEIFEISQLRNFFRGDI